MLTHWCTSLWIPSIANRLIGATGLSNIVMQVTAQLANLWRWNETVAKQLVFMTLDAMTIYHETRTYVNLLAGVLRPMDLFSVVIRTCTRRF